MAHLRKFIVAALLVVGCVAITASLLKTSIGDPALLVRVLESLETESQDEIVLQVSPGQLESARLVGEAFTKADQGRVIVGTNPRKGDEPIHVEVKKWTETRLLFQVHIIDKHSSRRTLVLLRESWGFEVKNFD